MKKVVLDFISQEIISTPDVIDIKQAKVLRSNKRKTYVTTKRMVGTDHHNKEFIAYEHTLLLDN